MVFRDKMHSKVVLLLDRVNWRVVLTGAGLFGMFTAVLAFIQFSSPNLAGNDGYFHIRFAQVMRQQGLVPNFTWLPLTILNADDFYDHHFLYHVLMIPFTFGNLLTGAKWLAIIFPACAFFMGWVFLRGQRVPYAAVWALGFFAVSEAFLYRMIMPRVQAVSLLMLILMLHVALKKRYRWLLPLSFVFIWLYDAFLLVLIVVGAYVVMKWLLDGRFKPAPLIYTIAGLLLGLLINPYFSNNVWFIYHHILPKLVSTTEVRVGNEWYPYETWFLVQNSGVALLAFMAGVFALGFQNRRMDVSTGTLLATATAFGLMLFKSRRFVEYFPAFALLFCAVALAPLFRTWSQKNGLMEKLLPAGLALFMVGIGWFTVQSTRENFQTSTSHQKFAAASAWLRANTPARSVVFQTDWDDFTWLYFHNTHNTYTLGLDPTYMQSYNAEMYELWRDITRGWVENPGDVISTTFDAGYVLTDLGHQDFLYQAEGDSDLQEIYRDEYAVIFLVLNQPDKMTGEY